MMNSRSAPSHPTYVAAPLDTPVGLYTHIKAQKIAPGLLQAPDGTKLKLTKTGIANLTVHGVFMGRMKVGVDTQTGMAYAIKKYRLREPRLSNKLRQHPARTVQYLTSKLADEARFGTLVGSPVAITKLWVTDKHIYGQMALMDGDMDAAKRDQLWTGQSGALHAPTPAVREAMRSVLLDLQTMHARGYAHCDIKPANIFHRNAPATAHLGDFTMVRRLGDRTRAQGTPRHMAPEQAQAKRAGWALRDWASADVWAVGSSFMDMLVGNPFDVENVERASRLRAYTNWHHWKTRGGVTGKLRARTVPFAKTFKHTFGELDEPWRNFFMQLMHPDYAARPSATEAIRLLDAMA